MLGRRAASLAVALGLAAPAARAGEAAPATDPVVDGAEPAVAPGSTTTPKKKKKKRKHRADADAVDFRIAGFDGTAPAKVAVTVGALSGWTTLRASGAAIEVAADVDPTLVRGRWQLDLDVAAGHRQVIGADLDETRGALDLGVRWKRGPDLRIDGGAGVRGAWRGGWADQYQPVAGGLAPTDRYSSWERRVALGLTAIPLRHQHAHVGARYRVIDLRADPNFDAVGEPTHLVPSDRQAIELDGSWRYHGEGWKAGVGLEVDHADYDFEFARDAGTGLTHAGAGGPPPNPLYAEWTVEPSIGGDVDVTGEVTLGASYGYEIVDDVYQGYYSTHGHHPELEASWHRGALELDAKAGLWWRTFGPGSYAVGNGHPPLDAGTRRNDHRGRLALAARWALGAHLTAIASGELIVRRSNFPDYEPGVFPANRAYAIDWDYTNAVVAVGVELAR